MCLYITKGQEPKIAEKAIRVYKVLKQYGINNYATPYQYDHIFPGRKATSELIVELEDEYTHVIDVGLHSFRTLKSARKCKSDQYGVPVIIRCTIPKGATYYLGRFIMMMIPMHQINLIILKLLNHVFRTKMVLY